MEKKISIKVTFKNDCYSSEEYDENDDWSLIGSGTTIQEAVNNIMIKKNLHKISVIVVDVVSIVLREMVEVDGDRYYSDDEKWISENDNLSELGFPAKIPFGSLSYRTECDKFARELFQTKRFELKDRQKEEDERKLYLELQKKYG